MNDVALVAFDQLSAARAGMSDLRRLDEDEAITIRAAAIVVRGEDGRRASDGRRRRNCDSSTGGRRVHRQRFGQLLRFSPPPPNGRKRK